MSRPAKTYEWNGGHYTAEELAAMHNVDLKTLQNRLRQKWELSDALNTPAYQTPVSKQEERTLTVDLLFKLWNEHGIEKLEERVKEEIENDALAFWDRYLSKYLPKGSTLPVANTQAPAQIYIDFGNNPPPNINYKDASE